MRTVSLWRSRCDVLTWDSSRSPMIRVGVAATYSGGPLHALGAWCRREELDELLVVDPTAVRFLSGLTIEAGTVADEVDSSTNPPPQVNRKPPCAASVASTNPPCGVGAQRHHCDAIVAIATKYLWTDA